MASWLIVGVFLATVVYLINCNRNFQPLALVASVGTAMILCFFGFLFTGVINALLQQFGTPIETPLVQSLLVAVGVVIGLLIRHRWKRI
ncbi:hypothetical protein [Motiliproteus sp.]|uniref:hypothetical protein n=1 Tax=Motiliproteus sp. TaxID=1898955 RepID=UPI003BAA3C83